jgi:hypothetical protein
MHPYQYDLRKMLSAPEAAAYCGSSASTFAKLRLYGGGPLYVKLGRRVVYDPADLDHGLHHIVALRLPKGRQRDAMIRHKTPGPTTEYTVSRAPIEERLGQTFREASRRDSPVRCVACGKRVGRKRRTQKFCSRRCRQRDYWDRRALAKISAVVTHHSAHSTTPCKSSSKFNALQRPKTRRLGFGKAPLNLLGGGEWRWPGTTQLDAKTRATIVCTEIGGTFRWLHADTPDTGGFA